MIIGLKYCGGCNPKYDRGAAVRKLSNALKELNISFTPYREEEHYDGVLLVQGCERECLNDKKFFMHERIFKAVCREDFLNIKNELCALTDDTWGEE